MKCLLKYHWVKLPRACLPQGKGILGSWAKLAARAAFRKGHALYCGFRNEVRPGMWSGGIVGLKSILGIRKRSDALSVMDQLQCFGYIAYSIDSKTKHLEYQINDWILQCAGIDYSDSAVYATTGYGFLCVPRNITQRLVEQKYCFKDSDAWLDLWCHTTWRDPYNAFSFLAPVVQYEHCGAVLTLETLGQRWNWEKTKVWRFFQKHGDVFSLYRLPGSFGCLVFNKLYPIGTVEVSMPTNTEVERMLNAIRVLASNARIMGTGNTRLNKMVCWYSRKTVHALNEDADQAYDRRVSFLPSIIRAYFSPCWELKNCVYDCTGIRDVSLKTMAERIRGP